MPDKATKIRDRETWSHELDWWLNCRDAACGFRSNLGAQISVIERGSGGGGVELDLAGAYVHPYHDGQVGLGPNREAAFALDRKMRVRWQMLSANTREIFLAHYTGAIVTQTVGESRQRWPKGVESNLGEYAGVTMLMAIEADEAASHLVLVGAKRKPGKLERLLAGCDRGFSLAGEDKVQAKLIAQSELVVREAHREFYAITKEEAQRWVEGYETNPPHIPEPGGGAVIEARAKWWVHSDPELHFPDDGGDSA